MPTKLHPHVHTQTHNKILLLLKLANVSSRYRLYRIRNSVSDDAFSKTANDNRKHRALSQQEAAPETLHPRPMKLKTT